MSEITRIAEKITDNLTDLDIRVNVAIYEGSRGYLHVDVALFINDEEIFECVSRDSVNQLIKNLENYSENEKKQIAEKVTKSIDEMLDDVYDKDYFYKIERG